eukprot:TRINITY_DN21771_c0_g3_i1.p1 TRINITY_DN21771_c0_g3~~TRINITY_DN21771_c0_g3_i1.p1  ORF type:complete len:658 (-),score=89.72 TRINITY_DN21771_c0_g3_i1:227-2134(-)
MGWRDCLSENVVTVLPKTCYIQNLKLAVLFWSLRIICLAWCLGTMWENNALTSQVVPRASRSFWSSVNKTRYVDAKKADRKKPFCTNSGNFAYQYDADGLYKYQNAKCFDVRMDARYVKGEDELYFPSYIQEGVVTVKAGAAPATSDDCTNACTGLSSSYAPTGSINEFGKCMCEHIVLRDRFVVGVEENMVDLEHTVQAEDSFLLHTSTYEASSTTGPTDPGGKLKTIVREPITHRQLKVFEPGELIQLTLGQIFEFSKMSLDDEMNKTKPNYISGANMYPLKRLTGLSVEITMKYYNLQDTRHPKDHDGPVCYMEIGVRESWSSKIQSDQDTLIDVENQEGTYRHRYTYGIRVTFKVAGSYSFFDPQKAFTALATVFVYWSMPTAVITFLAQWCLGRLSDIYMEASCEPIRPNDLFHQLLIRSVAAQYLFRGIKHSLTHGDECAKQVTDAVILEEKKDATPLANPSHDSRFEFLTTSNKHEASPAEKEQRKIMDNLHALFTTTRHAEGLDECEYETLHSVLCGKGGMTLEEDVFIEGFTAGDASSLAVCSMLFDLQRRRGTLEWMFEDIGIQQIRERLHSDFKKHEFMKARSADDIGTLHSRAKPRLTRINSEPWLQPGMAKSVSDPIHLASE